MPGSGLSLVGACFWSPHPVYLMAFSTEAFGVSVAVNGAICLAVFLFFGLFRKAAFAHKFYAPKR